MLFFTLLNSTSRIQGMSICAKNTENDKQETRVGVYKRLDSGKERFISIIKNTEEMIFSVTPFDVYRDISFDGQFVLPSGSFPGMLHGGRRKLYSNNKKFEETLDGNHAEWSNLICHEFDWWIATADTAMNALNGSIVKTAAGKEWVIDRKFIAKQQGTTKTTNIRIRISKDSISLLGFNKQSITLPLKTNWKYFNTTNHQLSFDSVSLWKQPRPPMIQADLQYHEYKKDINILKNKGITAVVELWFSSSFLSKDYALQRFHVLTEDGNEIRIAGTPQIKPGFRYRYGFNGYVNQFTDRFHPDISPWSYFDRANGYVFLSNNDKIRMQPLKYEKVIDFTKIWDSLVGTECTSKETKEKVYVAPDFHLLSFEGEYLPTIEGCQ
jgi:hypothetical protein